MSDESRVEATPDSRLLRNADRLAFGVRPAGFVLISRTRLLASKGISQTGALLIDQWVARAGAAFNLSAGRTRSQFANVQQRTTRPETIVWGVPAQALKHADA